MTTEKVEHVLRVIRVMKKICTPLPRNNDNNIPFLGDRKTSPCTNFQPNSSWASSYNQETHNKWKKIRMGHQLLSVKNSTNSRRKHDVTCLVALDVVGVGLRITSFVSIAMLGNEIVVGSTFLRYDGNHVTCLRECCSAVLLPWDYRFEDLQDKTLASFV